MNPKLKLLILCALSASALNVFAQSLYVSNTAHPVESGMTYSATSTARAALQVTGRLGSYSGTDLTLSSTFSEANGRYGAIVGGQARLALSGGAITTTGSYGYGVYATGSSLATVDRVAIITQGESGYGLIVYNSSTMRATGVSVTSSGSSVNGFRVSGQGSYLSGADCLVDIANGAIGAATEGGVLELSDLQATVRAGSAFHMTGGTISVTGGALAVTFRAEDEKGLIYVNGGTNSLTLDQVQVQHDGNYALRASGSNDTTINLISTATLSGTAEFFDATHATVNLSAGSAMHSDAMLITGSSTVEFNLAASTLTGNTIAGDDSSVAITGSAGSVITGALTGNDNAVIDLTVSGPGSSFTGDIAQHDDSTITVILDTGATGSGGFTGGNLITGGDSAWTFDKDSRGNNGENHGTWNIGDYDVTFDNMTNDGIININVNSDTGAGGSLTVTGTADGAGTVHLDTTGNGKADPNQVLPGVVKGDGTENW
ncbi:MAG: hypothetical protein LBK71_04290, partial [Verrucomicrobiales bacterium]|nr:hypothetical protein [Verrucomicrobiales bacterium]